MLKVGLLVLTAVSLSFAADADVDECIRLWKNSPFKKGTDDYRTISAKVKVIGIGANVEDSVKTDKPELVLVKPGVAVMSKQRFALMNPNGWYCLKGSVAVLGKSEISIHCKAHLASGGDGAAVLGDKDDSQGGVAVLGKIEVTRVGCEK